MNDDPDKFNFMAAMRGRESMRRRPADGEWGRPLFKAPGFPNARSIFDPLPFRTQVFRAMRPKCGGL
jgi:hypothetical protein